MSATTLIPITLFLASGLQAQEFNVARIFRVAAPSVGTLIALDQHQQPLAYGTAFFVDDKGMIATNYHVIAGASVLQFKLGNRQPVTVEGVFGADIPNDLALLKVPMSSTNALPLTTVRPTVGERIIAIGTPLGLESTVSEGIVSGIRSFEDKEFYQITAALSPGSSGGPVLNRRGDVIGIATASFRAGQNLNFAVPSALLAELRDNSDILQDVALATRAAATSRDTVSEGGPDPAVRIVNVNFRDGFIIYWRASVYNGTQLSIRRVRVRAICWKRGVDVPIDFDDVTTSSTRPIPPGLAQPISGDCTTGTSRVEMRVLDYEIVR